MLNFMTTGCEGRAAKNDSQPNDKLRDVALFEDFFRKDRRNQEE